MRKSKREQPTSAFICGTCGADMLETTDGRRGQPGIWKLGAKVCHCPGHSRGWMARFWGEAHHHTSLHSNCWSCGGNLGCPLCSGIRRELMCAGEVGQRERAHGGLGPVWATQEALLEHGPLKRQLPEHYPPEWAAAYNRTRTPANTMPAAIEDNPFAYVQELVRGLTEASLKPVSNGAHQEQPPIHPDDEWALKEPEDFLDDCGIDDDEDEEKF
jgi:hypothetical protein